MSSANESINELVIIEPIKVWSLLVTLLGDLGTSEQTSISGKEINKLLNHIGIKPNAIRVALHRLKKEGWIETSKTSGDGREVIYSLSDNGLRETEAVYEDVYRSNIKYGNGWKLLILEDKWQDRKISGIPVFNHVAIVPVEISNDVPNAMSLPLDRNSVPTWFVQRLLTPEVRLVADRIVVALSRLDDSLDGSTELDRAAIRLLILHLWRRLALRDATWFHIWLYDDGALSQCHQQVTSRLKSI